MKIASWFNWREWTRLNDGLIPISNDRDVAPGNQAVHSTVTKKMPNFLVKNEKKWRKCPKKCHKKHYASQVENKLVSKHNKSGTIAYFITNNLYVL